VPPHKKKALKKKKAKPKKKAASKARKVRAELVKEIKNLPAASKVTDVKTLKKRMKELWGMTRRELNAVRKSSDTRAYDLILLRILKDAIDFGDILKFKFYASVVLGDATELGVGNFDQDGQSSPVTVFQLPANGSETLPDAGNFEDEEYDDEDDF